MTEGECSHGKTISIYPEQKRDAVLGLLTKRKTVAETCPRVALHRTMLS